jgi:serine/threonine protein kinase/Tfp pilus assembly protein PilF
VAVKCPKCQIENPETLKFCGECGTRLIPSPLDIRPEVTETLKAPLKELTTGSTFAGRYQIIEELGKGGMGRVYKVFDTDIKEKVAMKLLKPEIASDPETIERFSNELKYARKIRHKNVCGMYDLGKAEGTHYITMEYVPGEDLKTMIRMTGSLTGGATLSIGKQVCSGLAEAHSQGVVHRDLKPQNIMIDRGGNAKIMDFGIARSLREKGITGASVLIGTPEYMSPEQAEAKEIDQRSDIYSLGVILYEMATGRVPFEGETALSIVMKHKTEIPKSPTEFNPHIPDDLSGVILKCLEKDRTRRFQTAAEVRAELEKIEKGIPTTERVVPERKTLTSREITVTFRLKKLFVPALAVTLLAMAGLLLWRPWSKKSAVPPPPPDKPSLAVMYFENNTGDEQLDHWRKGISDLLITDLTQSRYLKVLGGDRLFDILSRLDQIEAKSFSSEVLKEVAVQGGVNHIARGSYSKAGEILRIDMTLQDARSGEPIATQRMEGKGEESIFGMVDALTKWTKTSLKISAQQVASDLDKDIGQVTTSSPEAYHFYLEGRKLYSQGQWEQSVALMEKAIALDPGFAMAFRSMAVSYRTMSRPDEMKKYLRKALDLSDRISEREKLLIQGDYYKDSESTYDQAIEAYEKLVSLYPESAEAEAGNVNSGILYAGIEEWDKAIERYEAAIAAGTNFAYTYSNLAIPYMAKGEYAKAKTVLESGLDKFPENRLMGHFNLGMLYAFQGKFDLALNEADKAAAIDPTYTRGRFYHLMWDFVKAEEVYKKWLGFISPGDHLLARQQLEYLYRTQGRFEEAKDQIRLGIDLAEKLKRDTDLVYLYYFLAYHHLRSGKYGEALEAAERAGTPQQISIVDRIYGLEMKGWISAEMGKLAEARNTAEEIKKLVDTSPFKKGIRHHHFLTGMIQLKAKNYSDAVESFKKAISLLPHPYTWDTDDALYMYPLALAYYDSGNMPMARAEFERMVAFLPGRTVFGDLYAQSHYKLGLIYERQGDQARAKENYEKFLDLWKDADPGLPEVEDAKKRLAGLKG